MTGLKLAGAGGLVAPSVVAIIQARMARAVFPRQGLTPFKGRAILDHVLAAVEGGGRLVSSSLAVLSVDDRCGLCRGRARGRQESSPMCWRDFETPRKPSMPNGYCG